MEVRGIQKVSCYAACGTLLCCFPLKLSARRRPPLTRKTDGRPATHEKEQLLQKRSLFALGEDLRGRPTLVACPCMHRVDTETESLQAVNQCREVLQQTLMQLHHDEKGVFVLYDLGGATSSNVDITFVHAFVNDLLRVFHSSVDKFFVLNGHSSLAYAWSAMQIFLGTETAKKVVFCGSNYDELCGYIDSDHPYLQHLKTSLPVGPKKVETQQVGQSTLFALGEDRRGRPTLVARPCMHLAATEAESLHAVKECIAVLQDAKKRLPAGEHQLLILYDLAGAGLENLDITFAKALIKDLQVEFNDNLDAVLVFNHNWMMNCAWNTIRKLLPPWVVQQVVFCSNDSHDKLLDYVDADHPFLAHLKLSESSPMSHTVCV